MVGFQFLEPPGGPYSAAALSLLAEWDLRGANSGPASSAAFLCRCCAWSGAHTLVEQTEPEFE
eukprot:CAMPEP_0179146988 /NCGR_PEP_ID=MMETSP0796-20121207/71027_1 /TAXON_ID=73915 /ORGANISM="Pyrodinium bahamense, Strain pbaha01" /LENGTH=62 /DNA_ID=CAMNT_0020847543 /DNA_START=69 /DNA_END=255 /DNA_ORIENTATION=-